MITILDRPMDLIALQVPLEERPVILFLHELMDLNEGPIAQQLSLTV